MTWFAVATLAVAAAGLGFWAGRRVRRDTIRRPMAPVGGDPVHVLDLLRRAHRGLAATLLLPDASPISTVHPRGVERSLVDRAGALARLALSDGQRHALRDQATTVAVAHEGLAAAFVFATAEPREAAIQRVTQDLNALVAGIAEARARTRRGGDRRLQSQMAAHDSLDSAAAAVCEAARELTGESAVVAVRDPNSRLVHILGVSSGGDRRLLTTSVSPDSAAARAITEATLVAGRSAGQLLGHFLPDRRRRREQGVAFPIYDGKETFASLVVFARPDVLLEQSREDVTAMLADVGPHFGHLVEMRAAERRAMTDELTGLPNRRGLHRVMATFQGEFAALLCVDIDHFKRLNDAHGHPAGDAALRHLGRLLRGGLRERDLAVRMGGEEFALWLPETPLVEAREVAERVRSAIERTPAVWGGQTLPMTCSIGVAAVPDTTTDLANLYAAADAALYRAKTNGRNRVEVAERRRATGEARRSTLDG